MTTDNQRTPEGRILALLSRVGFWGSLSLLVSVISLAFPWWGIDISTSWGVFWGPPASPATVVFSPDRLTQMLSANYGFILSLVALTSLLAALGTVLKRGALLTVALISSVVTDLAFVGDIAAALGSECQGIDVRPASCISGLVGSGAFPGSPFITWGFKAGFYLFIASGILVLVALIIQRNTVV